MKKIYTLLSLMLISAFSYAQLNPGFFQLRLTKIGGTNTSMHVQMRAISSVVPTTSDFCSDLGFRLHWSKDSITGVDMVQATSINANLNEQAKTGSTGNWIQAIGFCANCNFFLFPANWTQNVWVTVGTINLLGTGGSPSDFDILPFNSVLNVPNIGVNFDDYTPANGALPLNLISFKAEKSGSKDALISWATTNEENTSHFVVERSYDKLVWSTIGSVAAAGYSIGVEQYSFTDVNVYNGRDSHMTVYYRLQMVDLDGRNKTSPIGSVVFGTGAAKGQEFVAYPNPTTDGLQVEWDANSVDQPTMLEFYDLQGKLVYSQKVSDNTNQEYIDLTKTNMQPGLFMLRILNGTEQLDYKQIVVSQH